MSKETVTAYETMTLNCAAVSMEDWNGAEADFQIKQAAPALLAACEAWLEHFDMLAATAHPDDPTTRFRDFYHGGRIKLTRDAVALARQAEGGGR